MIKAYATTVQLYNRVFKKLICYEDTLSLVSLQCEEGICKPNDLIHSNFFKNLPAPVWEATEKHKFHEKGLSFPKTYSEPLFCSQTV